MKANTLCQKCMFFVTNKNKDGIKIKGGFCLSPNAKKEEICHPNCEHFLPNDLN